MKLEDENFEEEFLNWLNSKSKKELINSLKKYAIVNDECIYTNTRKSIVKINDKELIGKTKLQPIKLSCELSSIIIKDKMIESEGENKEWKKELILAA